MGGLIGGLGTYIGMPNIPDAEAVTRTARFDQELAQLSEVLPRHVDESIAREAIKVLKADLEATHSMVFSLTKCVPKKYWTAFIDGATAALLSPKGATPIWAGMCAVADYRSRESRKREDDRES